MTESANIASVPAVILAGGLATRLRPLTETIPKALVEVAGRPFIDHQLALLKRNGFYHVVLCLGHLGEQVQAHIGDGSVFQLRVDYSFDGEQLVGTGGALRRALPKLGEMCWVLYGDSYLDIQYQAVLKTFNQSDALGMMTVLHNHNLWDTSNVIFRNGRLVRYDKRQRVPEMEYIDYGATLLRTRAIERIPTGQVFDLADLYSALVAEEQMIGYEVTQRFYEVGSMQGLATADEYLSQNSALWSREQ